MHELSVTSQIIKTVLSEAKKYNAKKVLEVHLDIGKLTFLGIEQVRFSYELLVKDTILENSRLYIEEKNGIIKCNSCGYEGEFKYKNDPVYHIPKPILLCPKCEETIEVIGGRECKIRDVKLLIEEHDNTNAD